MLPKFGVGYHEFSYKAIALRYYLSTSPVFAFLFLIFNIAQPSTTITTSQIIINAHTGSIVPLQVVSAIMDDS
jgi:hypothetical protein